MLERVASLQEVEILDTNPRRSVTRWGTICPTVTVVPPFGGGSGLSSGTMFWSGTGLGVDVVVCLVPHVVPPFGACVWYQILVVADVVPRFGGGSGLASGTRSETRFWSGTGCGSISGILSGTRCGTTFWGWIGAFVWYQIWYYVLIWYGSGSRSGTLSGTQMWHRLLGLDWGLRLVPDLAPRFGAGSGRGSGAGSGTRSGNLVSPFWVGSGLALGSIVDVGEICFHVVLREDLVPDLVSDLVLLLAPDRSLFWAQVLVGEYSLCSFADQKSRCS